MKIRFVLNWITIGHNFLLDISFMHVKIKITFPIQRSAACFDSADSTLHRGGRKLREGRKGLEPPPSPPPTRQKEAPRMSTNGSTNATICEIDAGLMKEIRKFRFSREVKNRALVMKVLDESWFFFHVWPYAFWP